MFDENQYKHFQLRIKESALYRYFWIFWGNYAFAIYGLVAVWILLNPELQENWQALLGLSFFSFALTRGFAIALLNKFLKTIRPYQQFQIKPVETKFFSFRDNEHDSFPSRHTAAYFSVAIVVFMFHPIIGVILIAAGILAGIGRVVMGWHWPSDILGGAIVGSAVGLLCYYFASDLFFTLT